MPQEEIENWSQKTSPQRIPSAAQTKAPRENTTGDESKPTIVLTITNKIRVLFFELEKKGVLKIVKCWNFGESFYGTRHSERFSRLYQQKVQISITGQEAYCLVFGSQIKFSPAHPQSAHCHPLIYSISE